MEFKVRKIDLHNIDSLRSFIQNLGESSSNFRYFESRPLNIIENHLVTVLASSESGEEIGYGHLDQEANVIWLGIAVAGHLRGKGIGTLLMKYLLDFADKTKVKEIRLAVDKSNDQAFKMYKRYGFDVFDDLGKSYLMVRYA
jgi:ribosomal protein S18 acetylase RimI-like enzyme